MKNIFSFKKQKETKKLSSSSRLFIGSALIILAIFLFSSFVSYVFSGEIDQSSLNNFFDKNETNSNILGKLGARISEFFIYNGFGISSIILSFLIFLSALHILLDVKNNNFSYKEIIKIGFKEVIYISSEHKKGFDEIYSASVRNGQRENA